MLPQWENRVVWEHRKAALDELADQLLWEIECCHNDILRPEVLKSVICCFKQFLDAQYTYFNQVIFVDADLMMWEQRVIDGLLDYPADHVMEITLQQASYDLDVIRRVIHDRTGCYAKDEDSEYSSDNQANCMDVNCVKGNTIYQKRLETLRIADCLAYYALKPAIDSCLIAQNTQVFTYFQKSANIRLIPYASIALIGIPETAASERQDLLAIPHEAGHYVFWHGTEVANPDGPCDYDPRGNSIRHTPFLFLGDDFRNKSLEEQQIYINVRENIVTALKGSIFCAALNPDCFPVNPSPEMNTPTMIESFRNSSLNPKNLYKKWRQEAIAYSWQEEIFCDVYGCLIAGAVITLDFQDLQLKWSRTDFFGEDGEHPAPPLRPYIYELVLKYLKEEFEAELTRGLAPATPQQQARLNGLAQLLDEVREGWQEKLAQRGTARTPTFSPLGEWERYKKYISRMYTLSEDTPYEELPLEAREVIEALSSQSGPIDISDLIDIDDLNNLNKPINKIIKGSLAILGNIRSAQGADNVWRKIQENVNEQGHIHQVYPTYKGHVERREVKGIDNVTVVYDPCSEVSMNNASIECIDYDILRENWYREWPTPSTWPRGRAFWLPIFKAGGWVIRGPNEPWDKK